MPDKWFEIANEKIDIEDIEQRVQMRLTHRQRAISAAQTDDPVNIVRELWHEMIGDPTQEIDQDKIVSLQQRDCDIVPHEAVIDWQIPILGHIHALVRHLINAEIRRFLFPSLERQSFVNRQILQALEDLAEENRRLRLEIENLRNRQK